jgi:hypothetical protein
VRYGFATDNMATTLQQVPRPGIPGRKVVWFVGALIAVLSTVLIGQFSLQRARAAAMTNRDKPPKASPGSAAPGSHARH